MWERDDVVPSNRAEVNQAWIQLQHHLAGAAGHSLWLSWLCQAQESWMLGMVHLQGVCRDQVWHQALVQGVQPALNTDKPLHL